MKMRKKALFCIFLSLAAHVYAKTYHGVLQVIIEDNFKQGRSKTSHYLEMDDKLYLLKFKNKNTINSLKLLSGVQLSIDGEMKKTSLGESHIHVKKIISSKKLMLPAVREIGDRHVLTLLVDFENKKTTSYTSIDKVNKHLYLGNKSVRNMFLASSFGQLNFVPDTNGDGQNDIYQVKLDYIVEGCVDFNKWSKDAQTAVQAQGVDLSLYRYFVIVLPNKLTCSWDGLATVGCGLTCNAWITAGNNTRVYAHELGHNLSFSHASSDPDNVGRAKSIYGDGSNFMGKGYYPVNAPHRDQVEWYASYPDNIEEINTTKTVTLYGLEKNPYIDSIGLQIVKFDKPNTPRTKYYLSYRTNTGKFGMSDDTYANKVSVHTHIGIGNTLLVKTIGAGRSFVDPENGYNIKVKDVNEDFATVKIKMGNKCVFKKYPCDLMRWSTFSDLNGKKNYFFMDIPAETSKLTITTKPDMDTNNISLLVKYNGIPTQNSFDCRSDVIDNQESCMISNPEEGRWYIVIDSGKIKHSGINISSNTE